MIFYAFAKLKIYPARRKKASLTVFPLDDNKW